MSYSYNNNDPYKYAALEKKAISLEALVEEQRQTISSHEHGISSTQNEVYDLREQISENQRQLAELRRENERLRANSNTNERDDLTRKAQAQGDEVRRLQAELYELQGAHSNLDLEIIELRAEKEKWELERAEFTKKLGQGQASSSELAHFKHLYADIEDQIATLQRQIGVLTAEKAGLQGQVAEYQHKVQAQQKETANVQYYQEIQRYSFTTITHSH
jgi:chromosome segregation ATPase